MNKVEIRNPSGKPVGWFHHKEKTYYRLVDAKAGQIFLHPKYQGAVAISKSILQQLAKLKCEKFQFQIINFEEEPFELITTFKNFMEHREDIYFKGQKNSDKQYFMRMHHWTRMYKDQRKL